MCTWSSRNTSLSNETQNDQVEIQEENFFSDVRGRNTIEVYQNYDKFPPITTIPPSLKMPFEQILNKPYLAQIVTWTSAMTPNTNIITMGFPLDFLVNGQLRTPFEVAAKYRLKACVYLQVTGTPLHAGLVLASAVPTECLSMSVPGNRNSFLQAPHVFLSANEATPVCLEIPFYSNTKLLETNVSVRSNVYNSEVDYAELQLNVWNQLVPGTSGSTSLSISIHVMFTQADFYVPKNDFTTWNPQSTMVSSIFDMSAEAAKKLTGDFIDKMRGLVKSYTGLHNPNIPILQERMLASPRNFSNNVDIPTYFEKLDPYTDHNRVVVENTFYTDVDEMDIKTIISKPQYVGTFAVNNTQNAGAILWSRPITPSQDQIVAPYYYATGIPMQTLALLTRYWKGKIKLHIQSAMTNFHNVRFMVARNYSNDSRALQNVPDFYDCVALQSTTLEFSGGSQVQTIDLEYCSELEQLPNTTSAASNALQHGMYYIYLAQPLVLSGQVATEVEFNVYISAGEDFEYYGYSTLNLETLSRGASGSFSAQSVMVEPSKQSDLANKVVYSNPSAPKNFRPVVSTREFIRRFAQVATVDLTTASSRGGEYDTKTIKISDLFSRYSVLATDTSNNSSNFQRVIRQFYFGQTGGLKFKFHFYNAQDAQVKFSPPTPVYIATSNPTQVFSAFSEPSASVLYNEWIKRNNYPWDDSLSGDVMSPPFIETGTWTKPYLSQPDAVSSETMNTSQIQIECMIPNMNNLEFVGDKTWFADNSLKSNSPPYSSDMGDFVLTALARNSAENTLSSVPVRVVIYMAYADEARFGFNVCCPIVRVPSIWTDVGIPPVNYEYLWDTATNQYAPVEQLTSAYVGAYIGTRY